MTFQIADTEFDHIRYDAAADVLYLSVGEPSEAADTRTTRDGHAIRYNEAGQIIGMTIVNAKWLADQHATLEVPSRFDADRLTPALA